MMVAMKREDETYQEWRDRDPEGYRQWSETRRAPRPEGAARRAWRHLVFVLARLAILVILVAGAWWWFGVYDTARGRCERGDLGACIVWDAQERR